MSKIGMVPIKRRDTAGVLIAAILSGVLYRYWLITPVLEYLTINEWRVLAVLVMLVIGSVWPLFEWKVSSRVVGFIAGILVSGAWLEWRAQDALPASFGSAFQSHLESFWPDVTMLTAAVMLGAYCSKRLRSRNFA